MNTRPVMIEDLAGDWFPVTQLGEPENGVVTVTAPFWPYPCRYSIDHVHEMDEVRPAPSCALGRRQEAAEAWVTAFG